LTAAEAARILQEEEDAPNDDMAWNEFQAMIHDDNDDEDENVVIQPTKKHAMKKEDFMDDEIVPDDTIDATTTTANNDTTDTMKDMEQASFEARIAMLRNRQKSKSTPTTTTTTTATATVSSAAFQQKRTFDGLSALELLRMKRAKEQRLAASIDDDDD
jgi:hypothetical protein